jgi:sugar phosphate isomerase/epimerase
MIDALRRLSLNQKTTNSLTLPEAVDACRRAQLESIGVWREPVADFGVQRSARLLRDAGLRVSSLCRGGFLTAVDRDEAAAAFADNVSAIREAAELDAQCLVMVVGGLPPGSKDLPGARRRVVDAIDELAPVAAEHGVRLALEPMHPIFTADRGVLTTMAQTLDIAERYPAEQVGVAVDTFHVWWDPDLDAQLARARGRILCFQICDWITPLPPDALLSRGMVGDGHIDFRRIFDLVCEAGYDGDVEVEIFNADVWATNADAVVATMKARYRDCVVEASACASS